MVKGFPPEGAACCILMRPPFHRTSQSETLRHETSSQMSNVSITLVSLMSSGRPEICDVTGKLTAGARPSLSVKHSSHSLAVRPAGSEPMWLRLRRNWRDTRHAVCDLAGCDVMAGPDIVQSPRKTPSTPLESPEAEGGGRHATMATTTELQLGPLHGGETVLGLRREKRRETRRWSVRYCEPRQTHVNTSHHSFAALPEQHCLALAFHLSYQIGIRSS